MGARLATGIDVCPAHADCHQCGLRNLPIVLSDGPDKATLAIVGEAPGDDEVRYGKPFIGRAGRLLNRALEEAGLDRKEIFITNSTLCRPLTDQGEHRAPTPEEIASCNGRLMHELYTRGVEVIVAMGTSALIALGIKGRIGQQRAQVIQQNGFTVIPTWHTAFALRSPKHYPDIVSDLRLAKQVLEGAHQQGGYRMVLKVVDTLEDIRLVRQWLKEREVVIDFETAVSDRRALCLGVTPVIDRPGVVTVHVVPEQVLRSVLTSDLRPRIIAHNAQFEYQVLVREFGITPEIVHDTEILHYLTDERSGIHALDKVVHKLYPTDPDRKAWERFKPLREKGLENIPVDDLHWYNAMDVYYTARILRDLLPKVDDRQWPLYRELLIPVAHVLGSMETLGVHIDAERLEKATKEQGKQVKRLEEDLKRIVGDERFNPRSYQQIGDFLYNRQGFPVLAFTDTGKPATNVDTLRLLQQQGHDHEFIHKLLEYRSVQKTVSTYLLPINEKIKWDGRLHGGFRIPGTTTGRLASSSPNLQNITAHKGDDPGLIRNLFVATPGYSWISADYSQLEVRVMAFLSEDPTLIDACAEGDLHTAMAVRVFKRPAEEITKELRHVGKTCTFEVMYGGGAEKLREIVRKDLGVNIPLHEAEHIIESWFQTFPKVYEYHTMVKYEVHTNRELWTPLGRRRRWPIPNNDAMREAVNFPVQSVASDITLTSLLELSRRLPKDDRLLLIVHDEIDLETRRDVRVCAQEVKDVMTEVAQHITKGKVVIKVDVEAGDRWGSLKEVL